MMDLVLRVEAPHKQVSTVLLTGPHILGMFLAWYLLGIINVQLYLFHLGRTDNSLRRGVVWFVYGIVLLEWVQTICMTVDAFHWFVFGWGNTASLNDISLIWLNVPLMGSIISCAVQIFFAWQIRKLSRSNWIPGLITMISLAHAGTGIVSGIKVRVLGSLSRLGTTTTLVTFTHVAEAAADIIIAGSMTFFLFRMKSGMPKSDTQVTKIVRLFLETGLLTSTVAILDVIFFFMFPPNTLHDVPSLMLPKLYTNALLAVLNNKVFIGNSSINTRGTSGSLPLGNPSYNHDHRMAIHVDITRETQADHESYEMQDKSASGSGAMHVKESDSQVFEVK